MPRESMPLPTSFQLVVEQAAAEAEMRLGPIHQFQLPNDKLKTGLYYELSPGLDKIVRGQARKQSEIITNCPKQIERCYFAVWFRGISTIGSTLSSIVIPLSTVGSLNFEGIDHIPPDRTYYLYIDQKTDLQLLNNDKTVALVISFTRE
ncbi:hypothetical protein LOZ58_006864 [Ophidiomyces ophidiicola]|nr:hypothetical protein LOZ65_006879 [Ophidiomyces ophidiicola]KAI1932496.1 hypothetical protein LOZ66_006856 [Ophidiomyces ophidiicola]KAI1955089.1 hypothetical protein LOZ58_006864 [Ophidiomyces ophidiicola]